MERHLYQDFDAFAESVAGIDAAMMLQNPKHRLWSIERVEFAGIHIQRGRLGSGNIVEGQSWSGAYGLYLPLSDVCEYSANGTLFGQESFTILEPGNQFCITTKDEHDWCSVLVPTHLLAANPVSVEGLESVAAQSLCRVSRTNTVLANTFATLVRDVIEAANTCVDFESSPAAEAAARVALTVVSEVVQGPKPQEDTQQGRPRIPRREVIRRCKQLFEERRWQPIRVSHLAAAAGVSERTLETATKEYFGVCPKRYLLVRQLHSVRHALLAPDLDAESVTEIPIRHGEWEFSRFARRYRDLFGELPSATLKSREPRRSPYGGRAILWSDPAGIER